MAIRTLRLGSLGPFPFDDANSFSDGKAHGLHIDKAPLVDSEVVRLGDVGSGGPVAPGDAQYLVLALDGDLDNERRLVAGNALTLTDSGANGDATLDIVEANIDHGSLGGLLDDDHSQYALLAGRAGGQLLKGGSAASDAIQLQATTHVTPDNTSGVVLTVSGDVLNDPILIVYINRILLDTRGLGNIELDGGVLVNNDNEDADFQIKGQTDDNLFFIDASADKIGIGTNAPLSKLHIALATEDLEIVDAGSIGATEQDWIEVEVGGVVGYIRVFSAK